MLHQVTFAFQKIEILIIHLYKWIKIHPSIHKIRIEILTWISFIALLYSLLTANPFIHTHSILTWKTRHQ